jgi:23S rRNA (uracil1939-C5)-methyltransferase
MGYRNRLNLRVAGGEVGFYRGATHDLIPITHCLLAEAEVDLGVPAARQLVRLLDSKVRRLEIVARGSAPGVVLHAEIEGDLQSGDAARVDTFLHDVAYVSGIVLQGRRWRRTWGDVMAKITPADGIAMTLPAGVFSQVNPLANRLLVETVLALGDIAAGDRILELYAGAGNLTLPLAQRAARVVAVEQHDLAAAAATTNAAVAQGVEIRVASAVRAVEQVVAAREQFDIIVLDPPRSGAADVVNGLLKIAPRRIVYVSCNPTTLARDLARLAVRYRVESVQPIDMFPHTYHVECVVRTVLT